MILFETRVTFDQIHQNFLHPNKEKFNYQLHTALDVYNRDTLRRTACVTA